jgi:hypothetical protein
MWESVKHAVASMCSHEIESKGISPRKTIQDRIGNRDDAIPVPLGTKRKTEKRKKLNVGEIDDKTPTESGTTDPSM